jgi:hypothetical protein
MKKTITNACSAATVAFLSLPLVVGAQQTVGTIPTNGGALGAYLQSIITFINNVLIPFLLAIGFAFFVWGMFRYFIVGGTNEDARESGKSLIVYSVLGFVLILVFWGIVNIVADATGLEGSVFDTTSVPDAPAIPVAPSP